MPQTATNADGGISAPEARKIAGHAGKMLAGTRKEWRRDGINMGDQEPISPLSKARKPRPHQVTLRTTEEVNVK